MIIAVLIFLAPFRLADSNIKKKNTYLPCSSHLLNLVNLDFHMGNFENVHYALNGSHQLLFSSLRTASFLL